MEEIVIVKRSRQSRGFLGIKGAYRLQGQVDCSMLGTIRNRAIAESANMRYPVSSSCHYHCFRLSPDHSKRATTVQTAQTYWWSSDDHGRSRRHESVKAIAVESVEQIGVRVELEFEYDVPGRW